MKYLTRSYTLLLFITVNFFTLGVYNVSAQSIDEMDRRIKIIANVSDENISLSKQQIKNIFMGSSITGYDLKAVVLDPNNISRIIFNTKVIGLTESRIQSYWVQMHFTGRKKPPKEFNSAKALVEYIQRTPGGIGYVPTNLQLPEGLVVLYQTDK